MKRRDATSALAACILGGVIPAARAQGTPAAWPTRPVRLLVGFPGGSTPDMAARTLADVLAPLLGQPVFVENKPGASGNIATDQVAKAQDDHTLGVVINGNLTSAKLLNPRLGYDPAKDFSLISLLTTAPLVLVAPPSLPDGAGFFAEMRKRGSAANYGSVGAGSAAHLGMELLKRSTGLQAQHVPYAGNPAVVTAILGGQVEMALIPPGVAMPQVRAGRLKAIGITSGRSALAPEVAPLTDAGVKNFNVEVWTALVGPASLPKAAQARLATEVPQLLRDATLRAKLSNQGWQAAGTSPEGLARRMREETALLGALIKSQNIQAD